MSDSPVIVWLRDDLRLADNPALAEAVETGAPVVVLFVLDEESPGLRPLGGAARWWLHHSLAAFDASLGGRLVLRRGRAAAVLPALVGETGAGAVFANRRYGHAAAVDAAVAHALPAAVPLRLAKANRLFEGGEVRTGSGGPFRVFTPFWRAALALPVRAPLPAPRAIRPPAGAPRSDRLADWGLLPTRPDWTGGLRQSWQPGEAGAAERLSVFLDGAIAAYAEERDRPDKAPTSRLSPHLRFGEISPYQVFAAVHSAADPGSRGAERFLAEVGWREFSWHLLDQAPDLATENFNRDFDRFPWPPIDPALLRAWQRGRTGYPIVDAGMRQLWATGWMHNRVRMVAASFLTKHLLQHWRAGEEWFWDTLVDADAANNPASWQWVAGSGADAAPYFRIFNPVLQGEKFDREGAYVRHWVPELAGLPNALIHRPWDASPLELRSAGIRRGETYPEPLVDHAAARRRALAAYEAVKAGKE